MKKEIKIEGMSCAHCVMHVKNALMEVKGVKDVQVDLKEKLAVVEAQDADNEALKLAVEDAGYDVTEIKDIK